MKSLRSAGQTRRAPVRRVRRSRRPHQRLSNHTGHCRRPLGGGDRRPSTCIVCSMQWTGSLLSYPPCHTRDRNHRSRPQARDGEIIIAVATGGASSCQKSGSQESEVGRSSLLFPPLCPHSLLRATIGCCMPSAALASVKWGGKVTASIHQAGEWKLGTFDFPGQGNTRSEEGYAGNQLSC